MRTRLMLICLGLLCFLTLPAQSYRVIDEASKIKFIIQNAGMATEGKFTGIQGNINFNPLALKNSSINVSINATTINTDIDVRDLALQSAEYLDTQKYPDLHFSSKQFIATGIENKYMLKGAITIKGISKDISFPFIVNYVNEDIVLKGDMKLNRRDFKIGQHSLVLSDLITVSLNVMAKKN